MRCWMLPPEWRPKPQPLDVSHPVVRRPRSGNNSTNWRQQALANRYVPFCVRSDRRQRLQSEPPRGGSRTLILYLNGRGIVVVAFDEGASLAGNESNDSCVTTSAGAFSESRRQPLPLFAFMNPAAA